jgi:hypothetical protein
MVEILRFEHDLVRKPVSTHRVKARGHAFRDHALANPTPAVRRQYAAAAVVVVRPIVKSGPDAGEEKAPVKTPVVKVVVMEGGEMREGVFGECTRSERMPSHDVWPHHMAAETVTGKGVAGKAGVPAETAVTGSAAMTATAAVTAPAAAMCDGAGRPNRCAERNGRGERNGHLQPHESLTLLSSVVGSLAAVPTNLRIVIVAARDAAYDIDRSSVVPVTKKLARFRINKCDVPLKLLMRQFLTQMSVFRSTVCATYLCRLDRRTRH